MLRIVDVVDGGIPTRAAVDAASVATVTLAALGVCGAFMTGPAIDAGCWQVTIDRLADHGSGQADHEIVRPSIAHGSACRVDHGALACWCPKPDPWQRLRDLDPLQHVGGALHITAIVNPEVGIDRIGSLADEGRHSVDPFGIIERVKPTLQTSADVGIDVVPAHGIAGCTDTIGDPCQLRAYLACARW